MLWYCYCSCWKHQSDLITRVIPAAARDASRETERGWFNLLLKRDFLCVQPSVFRWIILALLSPRDALPPYYCYIVYARNFPHIHIHIFHERNFREVLHQNYDTITVFHSDAICSSLRMLWYKNKNYDVRTKFWLSLN